MTKLTDKQYWDSLYERNQSAYCIKRSIENLLKNSPFRSYADYLLWEVIYPKYLRKKEGAKIVEIGSAPGTELVRMHKAFGFIPYGIEYSEAGVGFNRAIFAANGLEPANVIHADFLSGEIETKFTEYFDVVLSQGFIEHFDNPKDVIDKHITLLRKGGYLIVNIPNLRGANGALQSFFDKDLLEMHNIGIMEKDKFAGLFNDQRLSVQYCGYYGTLNFNLFMAKRSSVRRIVLVFCKVIQLPLNAVFRLLFGKKGAESKMFSPYLLFIGVRKE
jgi:SAM-dependent methyltransferase